jgi:hypothetical protein
MLLTLSHLLHFPLVNQKHFVKSVVQVFVLPRQNLLLIFNLVECSLFLLLQLIQLLFLDLGLVLVKRLWLATPLFFLRLVIRVFLILSFCVISGSFFLKIAVLLVSTVLFLVIR